MPTLLDHIDRFSYTAQAIQVAERGASEPCPSPYVRAVLRTPIEGLARDVDTSELGLFTLVPSASAPSTSNEDPGATAAQKGAIGRVKFHGATPLRKPAGASKHARRENDKEPEVYAQAALKYLDRYQSIRPMPRARQEVETIIERLNAIRNEIERLSEGADKSVKPASQPVSTIQGEEKRIQELHMRIKQMKARKEVLQKKQNSSSMPSATMSKDKEEEAFWSAPATTRKTRTGRKSLLIPTLPRGNTAPDDSLILDAHMRVDTSTMLGDVSMSSLPDAVPTPMPLTKVDPALVPLPSRSPSSSPTPSLALAVPIHVPLHDAPETPAPDESANITTDEGDATVILSKPPPLTPARPSTAPATLSTPSTPLPQVPQTPTTNVSATPGLGVTATPGTARAGRVKITTDVERIAAKIWSTVGEIIMPGHTFNTASAAAINKPPRAKETIALLQNLSSQKPPPSSPTTSHSTFSTTTDPSAPSTHAILTAHLLLALINTVPRHAMPLAATKVVLAEANKGLGSGIPTDPALGLLGGGDKAMETRALYGCVAKRLLKIDRSGREQLVRFDI